jgi:hypothetical protein
MMGLPEGHVTGHGLSAAQELKMLGNGVVPQQAALALRLLGGVRMTNKPKAIGTRGETAVVNVATRPRVRRRRTSGHLRVPLDLGDILMVSPGVIAEVKWGKARQDREPERRVPLDR